jgi:anti-sigma regulatory factor (Ser/Thr protein kinase)
MPSYDVRDWLDLFAVRRNVFQLATQVGFSRRQSGELAIVASELASNILKYGIVGSLRVDVVDDEHGLGLTIAASDRGPPFHDVSAALRDGWSDRGPIDPLDMLKRRGIGGGLGAVLRFTDSFRVETGASTKTVHVVRYLRSPRRDAR